LRHAVTGALPSRRALVALAVMVVALLVAGCSASAPSFDPDGPCVVNGTAVDGRAAGAYPDLEALVPRMYEGRAPDRLDSGRNCSERNLGSMVGRGIRELRFAGGLWELGSRSGVSLAVFRADGLTSAILFEFYETGARTAPKTEQTETKDVTVAGIPARRLDTLNDDSYQTVITWPGRSGEIRAVLVGSDVHEVAGRTVHESRVSSALAAFEPGGG
jgi:hypothetical protein